MSSGFPTHRGTRVALLAAIMAACSASTGHAGAPTFQVQIADSMGLPVPKAAPIAAPAVAAPQPAGLAPAPVPNEDLDDPALAAVATTRISPALLSRSDVFEGNGFSQASNIDHGVDERTPPAPGINVSVPVK